MSKKIVDRPSIINGFKVVDDGEEIFNCLKNGETVMHWETGNSMHPIISHLEYCKITPAKKEDIKSGQAVFCKVPFQLESGEVIDVFMVHRCTEIYNRDGELYFRIDSTDGRHFGWTTEVYGVAVGTNIFQDSSVLFKMMHQ